MDKKDIIIGLLCILLAGTSVTAFIGWQSQSRQMKDLERQIVVLQQKEKQSAIDRSVSAQLEEIANQDKEISDEQREEALQQTRIANEMRHQSEIERLNAIEAEQKAVQASVLAENQRQIAEHQRIQAEFSKRVADTLSYIALGRSLGSLSLTQQRTGDKTLADLLSYAAYLFTDRYQGDLYYPSIYQALSESSQSRHEWKRHQGALMAMDFLPGSNSKLVSVSNYGEVLLHEKAVSQLKTTAVFKDSNYDFRDIFIDSASSDIYAVSRSGHLFIKAGTVTTILPVENVSHPTHLADMGNRKLLIAGEDAVAVYDMSTKKITDTRQLDFKVTCVGRTDHLPLLFDDKGRMHKVRTLQDFVTKKVPVPGHVTAYANSISTRIEAYGMSDGSLYVVDKNGKSRRLMGHRSRISKLKLNGVLIYSSSYDGTVNLWIANTEKPEPMTIATDNSWIMNFTFDPSRQYMWTGNQNGNLAEVLISVPAIVDKVHKNLKRDLTPSEWNYYIGANIPYESFVISKTGNQRKEAP